MKIADEVWEELRKGRSLSEIRTKFRSASQVYEGLRTFFGRVGQVVERRQAAIRKTDEQLVEEQAELENAKAERRAREHDNAAKKQG